MLQFDAAPAVTSNPFSVNGKQFPSRNREMRWRPRDTFCSRSLRRAGRTPRHGAGATWPALRCSSMAICRLQEHFLSGCDLKR